MKRFPRNIVWEGQNITIYVRRRITPTALPQLVAHHRRELEAAPEQVSTRYLLANCLHVANQVEEAQSEWDQVATSGDEWAGLVAEVRKAMPPKA